MKTYKIPVTWESWGLVTVEAPCLETAKRKVLNGPLPYNPEYVEDSFNIDEEGISIYNEEIDD